MATIYKFLLVPSMTFCLVHAETGTATINEPPYVPSSCDSFDDEGAMVAAAGKGIFQNKVAWGEQFRVKCLSAANLGNPFPCYGNFVVVTIVNLCPNLGSRGTPDLAHEAFATIAYPTTGFEVSK